MKDLISRQAAIKAIEQMQTPIMRSAFEYEQFIFKGMCEALNAVKALPSAQPERKKMSNKEWVDFLSKQFTVSRTSAREMLHRLMKCKAEDNFKKQFSGGRNEKE